MRTGNCDLLDCVIYKTILRFYAWSLEVLLGLVVPPRPVFKNSIPAVIRSPISI